MTDGRDEALDARRCFVCPAMTSQASRFCSDRCREAFDAGFPPFDPNSVRRLTSLPLNAWRIVAGPPGSAIGERYYSDIPDRKRRPIRRRKVMAGPLSINSNFGANKTIESTTCKGTFGEARSAPGQQNANRSSPPNGLRSGQRKLAA
jgi:hypothetical protein